LADLNRVSAPDRVVLSVVSSALITSLIAYVVGLLLLPLYWLLERKHLRGWYVYLPVAALAGLVTAVVFALPDPARFPWTYYASFAVCGGTAAALFTCTLRRLAQAVAPG
jgi:hypothetical protein